MSNKLDYWLTNDVLIKTSNSIIYNVVIDRNNKYITEDEIKELQENQWVVKFFECFDNEVKIINSMQLYNNDLCIKMPLKQKFRCCIENHYSYYVMEKYDTDLYKDPLIAKKNFFILGEYIINFFKWLHLQEQKIHGDIKSQNIIIKKNPSNFRQMFRVVDYESIDNQKNNICRNSLPNGYYYYLLGCHPDKPFFSFRMDLEAFGYVLVSIVQCDNIFYSNSEWQLKAVEFYKSNVSVDKFDELEELKKNYNISNILQDNEYKNIILEYFNIIKEQDWESKPNPIVYGKLNNLFKKEINYSDL